MIGQEAMTVQEPADNVSFLWIAVAAEFYSISLEVAIVSTLKGASDM